MQSMNALTIDILFGVISVIAALFFLLIKAPGVEAEGEGKKRKRFLRVGYALLGMLSCYVISIVTADRLGGCSPFDMYLRAWPVTFLAEFALTAAIAVLFDRIWVGTLLTSLLAFVYGVVNHYVCQFRGTPLLPVDLLAVRTAAAVADNYVIKPDAVLAFAALELICTICICVGLARLHGRDTGAGREPSERLKRILGRTVLFVLAVGTCVLVTNTRFTKKVRLVPHYYLQQYGMEKYGAIYNFVTNIQACIKNKPRGYSANRVEEIGSRYVSDERTSASRQPNLVVIMNESWADIDSLGGLNLTESMIPHIEKIAEGDRALMGQVAVPAYGGGTNKTEFEFLTGSVTGFGLTGSVYDLDCTMGTMSLVSAMRELGYYTIAVHPEKASNWDRDKGYEKLGFDEFLSMEDLQGKYDLKALRGNGYTSDSSLYQVLYDLTDQREQLGKPVFIFCVTMQNHGGYVDSDYEPTVDVEDAQVAQYLSLVKETDAAFAELVDHYEKVEEDTLVLMFGDHLPNLDCMDALVPWTQPQRTTTPYIIWSNYDLDSYDMPDRWISVNFLQSLLMDVGGLPMTGFQKFLQQVVKEYPVINYGDYRDPQGEVYTINVNSGPEAIREYAVMQYNNLFDSKRLSAFFSYR